MNIEKVQIIQIKQIGELNFGYISVLEDSDGLLPFSIKRVYWTYFTPNHIERGGHAHHKTVQLLIAVSGIIDVYTEMPNGKKENFKLDSPDMGVLLPANCWHTMRYSHGAVQVVLASEKYNEKDYIRNYNEFMKMSINNKND